MSMWNNDEHSPCNIFFCFASKFFKFEKGMLKDYEQSNVVCWNFLLIHYSNIFLKKFIFKKKIFSILNLRKNLFKQLLDFIGKFIKIIYVNYLVSCFGLSGRQHQKKRNLVNLTMPHVRVINLIHEIRLVWLAKGMLGSLVISTFNRIDNGTWKMIIL